MQFLNQKLPLAAALTVAGLASASPLASTPPTVTIASGVVVGLSTQVPSGTSTPRTAANYLGIPFAAAPTGTLRFAPPAAPTAWSTPLQATKNPPACRQQFVNQGSKAIFNNPGGPAPPESEDCLFLNVYAPTDASPTSLKAVMFWIYGGDLDFGTISIAEYNGSSFAAYQDVVVVAANYRTNIFGFSGSPEFPLGQQNAGFLDQRFALQWVQDNIKQFGGDPNQVTIFGESAGGYSVKQLLAQPPQPLPFRAAIMESEAANFGNASASWDAAVKHYNCTTASSPLACLQAIDGLALEKYITTAGIAFYPVQDNITSTQDIRPSISSGKFPHIPILIGSNADEGRVFLASAGLDSNSTTLATVRDFLNYEIGIPALVNNAIQVYNGSYPTPFELGSAIFTDLVFTCSSESVATYLADYYHASVWRYHYNGTFPNEQLLPNLGAFHSSEIPQVFGTYNLMNALGDATPAQEGLSKYMQTTWANFAKHPHVGPGWPATTKNVSANMVGELGGPRNQTGLSIINASVIDTHCMFWNPIIRIEGY